MEMLFSWLISNWVSVVIVVITIGISVYLWQKGYKKQVSMYLLTLIAKAELQFEHGENKEKLMSVLSGVYDAFPNVLKFFYTQTDLIIMINDMVEDTKDWLQNQSK